VLGPDAGRATITNRVSMRNVVAAAAHPWRSAHGWTCDPDIKRATVRAGQKGRLRAARGGSSPVIATDTRGPPSPPLRTSCSNRPGRRLHRLRQQRAPASRARHEVSRGALPALTASTSRARCTAVPLRPNHHRQPRSRTSRNARRSRSPHFRLGLYSAAIRSPGVDSVYGASNPML
jgi:hypothetical protein